MSNEFAPVNIVRAKEGLPLHYTAVSRLSGSVVIKGATSISPLKGARRTFTGKRNDQLTSAGFGASRVDSPSVTGGSRAAFGWSL